MQWYFLHLIAYLYNRTLIECCKNEKGVCKCIPFNEDTLYWGQCNSIRAKNNIMFYINVFVPKGLCILQFRYVRKNEMHLTSIILLYYPLPPPIYPRFPPPCPPSQAKNFSCQCIVLGSLQFFLGAHAKPLLPPIIPGSHPPVLPHKQKTFHVSALYWAPFSFSSEHMLNPSYPLLSQVPSPMSFPTSNKLFMSVCCTGLPSVFP